MTANQNLRKRKVSISQVFIHFQFNSIDDGVLHCTKVYDGQGHARFNELMLNQNEMKLFGHWMIVSVEM